MKRIAIAVLLSAIAAPAFADGYVGVNVGQNKYDISGLPDDTSNAWGILAGFGLSHNLAVEIGYTDLGSVDIPGGSVDGKALNLSVLGSFPLNDQFSLYARVGAAQTKIEPTGGSSETKNGVTWGLGAQFNVNPSVGIRLGFDRYKVGETDSVNADLISVGAVFKF